MKLTPQRRAGLRHDATSANVAVHRRRHLGGHSQRTGEPELTKLQAPALIIIFISVVLRRSFWDLHNGVSFCLFARI